MMLRVCAWCGKFMGIKSGGGGTTHGMCGACFRRVAGKAERGLCRAVEAAGDAAGWLILIAAHLLAVTLLYLVLTTPADAGQTMEVTATAYSWREASHKKWGDRNAIGSSLRRTIEGLPQIAVDPRRIPLGSIVHVEGLGKRIATDTGGLIKGSKIDIHWQCVGEMHRWGKRRVEIEVVRRGWGSCSKTAQREGHRRAAARAVARRDAATPAPARDKYFVMALDSKGRRRG